MTDKEKLIKIKSLADKMYNAAFNLTTDASLLRKTMEEYHQFIIYKYYKEEPVSEDLEEASKNYALNNTPWDDCKDEIQESFKAGANWQKENFWKPAESPDLPIFDRGVIVLTQPYPLVNSEYTVSFAHRLNPDGWDGKSVITGKVEHYTPKTYGKGGWNIPDVKYWLDVEFPK